MTRELHTVFDPVASWGSNWAEVLQVRSPEDEARLLAEVRGVVAELQDVAGEKRGTGRALHPQGILDTHRACITIHEDLPDALRLGPLSPGAVWPVRVRLSSAFPVRQSDDVPDQRGLAVRIIDGRHRLDLLTTTGEAHHARDAVAMIASLRAAAAAARGGASGKIRALAGLLRDLGLRDALRMMRTVSRARVGDRSLTALDFYSRAPFQLGPYAVRYRFAAALGIDPVLRGQGATALADDLADRLEVGPVSWSFELQGFLDSSRTPMNDHRIVWDSPWIPVGSLQLKAWAGERGEPPPTGDARLPPRDAGSPGPGFRSEPDWPDAAGPVFSPLGDLNRLRAAAYTTSRDGRGAAAGLHPE